MTERNDKLRLTKEENPYILEERSLPSDVSYTTARTLLQGKAEAFSIGAHDQLAKVFRRRLNRPRLRQRTIEVLVKPLKVPYQEDAAEMMVQGAINQAEEILAFTPSKEEIEKRVRWEVGEELCCLIGNKMLEDREAGKLLGKQLDEYMKNYLKGEHNVREGHTEEAS